MLLAKRRRHFTLKIIPLAAWLVIGFFAIGVTLVVGSYWAQQQTEVTQKQEVADEKAAVRAKKVAFIKRLVPTAQAMQKQYGVLTSITLAQAILESNWGTSALAKDYHNQPRPKCCARRNMSMTNGSRSMAVFGCMTTTVNRSAIMRCYSLMGLIGIRNNMPQFVPLRTIKQRQLL